MGIFFDQLSVVLAWETILQKGRGKVPVHVMKAYAEIGGIA
jgi:hypothetical protein